MDIGEALVIPDDFISLAVKLAFPLFSIIHVYVFSAYTCAYA